MTVFISGGCKNGKSSLAQRLAVTLSERRKRYYVATMIPADQEDHARVARHVRDRAGLGFSTIECGRQILDSLAGADREGCFLLDSVTALLANEMFRPDGTVDLNAPERVAEQLCRFSAEVRDAVFVSDYLYSEAGIFEELTERYRQGLAHTDRALAACCDVVVEVCAGRCTVHKGVLPL